LLDPEGTPKALFTHTSTTSTIKQPGDATTRAYSFHATTRAYSFHANHPRLALTPTTRA
jgi:hypothetical protein